MNRWKGENDYESVEVPYGLTAKVFRSGLVFSLYFMLWFY